ncbi:MAG: DUF58 domain-containing protein [Longimicrobiales bacterium]|nr:DUF58 domain-containing protein [Longimicrobiales bacterium]
MPIPSRRTVALLVAATALSALSFGLALMAQLVVLAVAWVDGRRAPVPRARRKVEGTLVLNGRVDVQIDVTGAGSRVRITDDSGAGLERMPPASNVPDASGAGGVELSADAQGSVTVGYRLVLRRRGDLELGSIHLRTMGPWGFAWRRTEVTVRDRLRVLPGVQELRRERLPGMRPALAAVGLRRTRRRGEGLEFESLREYQRGDDPRTVDWKASARRTELVVRNYQIERNQTVVLAIDAGRLMREWIGDRERLDYALTSAFLLAERARLYGDRVGVVVFDQEVRTMIPAGRVRLCVRADVSATVESRLVEPNYPMAFATIKRTFRKRALVLMLSDIIDASASRALVDGLVGAVTRHLPVVVALRNPEVEAVSSSAAAAASPYRRAAAEALLESRAKALQSMRRAGVHVVDSAPGDAAGAALDKYAEIKRRGLL